MPAPDKQPRSPLTTPMELRLFTLHPGRATHTFNPLYRPEGADQPEVAERVFATLEHGLDASKGLTDAGS